VQFSSSEGNPVRIRSRCPTHLLLAVCGVLPALGPGSARADYMFTPLDYPGAAFTTPAGVNNARQITLNYLVPDARGGFVGHAALYFQGRFTSLDFPGSVDTVVGGINNRGQVVGSWGDASFNNHSFILTGGVYAPFNVPGAQLTFPAA